RIVTGVRRLLFRSLQAALQALDLAKPAMWNSLIGAACKLTVLYLLASNASFGIMGVALAMCVGVVLVTLLHLAALQKTIRFTIPLKDLTKMTILLLSTWGIGVFLKNIYATMNPNIFLLLLVLTVLTGIYIFLLVLLKFITKDELKQIPLIQKWVS